MEPNLLVGDRLFVTKYSYGYSKHSFPFSPPLFKGRIFSSVPKRGDVIVFKTPADNRTDYIKRLIGLPGDKIQFIDSNLYINNTEILKSRVSKKDEIFCGKKKINVFTFEEILSSQKKHKTVYLKNFPYENSDKFIVPNDHYFFLEITEIVQKIVDFYQALVMCTKITLLEKLNLYFFQQTNQ